MKLGLFYVKNMAVLGLTGQPIHQGSLFGLPDFGVTEKLSNYFNQGRTNTGGSNLYGDQSQTTLVPSGENCGDAE